MQTFVSFRQVLFSTSLSFLQEFLDCLFHFFLFKFSCFLFFIFHLAPFLGLLLLIPLILSSFLFLSSFLVLFYRFSLSSSSGRGGKPKPSSLVGWRKEFPTFRPSMNGGWATFLSTFCRCLSKRHRLTSLPSFDNCLNKERPVVGQRIHRPFVVAADREITRWQSAFALTTRSFVVLLPSSFNTH